jgi:translation initiation factor IF-2
MVVPKRMTEANEQEAIEQEQKRPLTLRSGGTLGLRRPVETGQVRQSFSHGRSKQVTVEVRKKRVLSPGAAPETGRTEPAMPVVARAQPDAPTPATSEPARRPVVTPRTLTAEETAMRVRVLQDARKADDDSRRRAALAEADRRRQEDERAAEETRLHAEEQARRRVEEEESKKRAEDDAKKHRR